MRMRHKVMWLVRIYTISPRCLIKGAFSKKKSAERKMPILSSSKMFVYNISHYKKKSAKYDQKYMLVFV